MLLTVFNAQPVYPHVGGFDYAGCHNNRKTGDRHCHRSKTKPSTNSAGLKSGPVSLLSVGDGDTIRITDQTGGKVTIRLAFIDAPETS
ncbi:YHYH domain-containing protein [Synechococcus sp. AH-551-E11]|nr:YHYH domain-containing protein [Synechococcus sp. AH-551-E11]MDB4616499.1 YHYH domain-containing protein [Synechococcus sp. AH-551-E11]